MRKVFLLAAALAISLSLTGCASMNTVRSDDSADGFVGEEVTENVQTAKKETANNKTVNKRATRQNQTADLRKKATVKRMTEGAANRKRSTVDIQRSIENSYARHGVH